MDYTGFILEWRIRPTGKEFQKFLPSADLNWSELEPGKEDRRWLPPFRSEHVAEHRMKAWQKRRPNIFEFRIGRRFWKERRK